MNSILAILLTIFVANAMAMESGTVLFYNENKGYGYIQPDSGEREVYVHATALERAGISSLNQGQRVRFDTQPDRRTGRIAVNNIQSE